MTRVIQVWWDKMGLENLQSIFNKINDNQADLHDGLPMESISNRLFDHTFGSNNAYQGLVKIGGIQNEQSPSPLMAITNVFGDSIVNGHSLGKIRVNFQGGLLQTHLDITGNENYPYAGNTSPFDTPGQPVPNTPDIEPVPVIIGSSNVLFVSICVPVSDTRVEFLLPILLPPGSVRVLVASSL